MGPCARARPQPAAAGVGVPATHHRGHLQPVVCLRARDGPGHPSWTCQYCSVAPSSGEESQNLPGQRSQCEKLECVDGAGNILTAPGGLRVGAVHPSLHRVQEPDQPAHRQRRQDEPVGEDVLPPSAEEPGPVLRGLGLADPEGGGDQPGLPA